MMAEDRFAAVRSAGALGAASATMLVVKAVCGDEVRRIPILNKARARRPPLPAGRPRRPPPALMMR